MKAFSQKRYIKNLTLLGVLGFVSVSSLFLYLSHQLSAAPVVGFNAGLIIDDSVFTDKTSMNVSQIQQFLNSKVPICDTDGTQPSEYGGGTRAQWGTSRGYPPPYICLKDYSENGQSASQIIYNVAQTYNINPQVLIVLLQKEQGLVTDTWPLSRQYRTATGYGCPDTAPCDSQYFGLTNQLNWSAKMFKAIMTASPTWYTPYVVGNNFIRWSPNSSCGGSNVVIQNRATQALYNYTPYQPNQASLNAGYGTGDACSAYGNRNFYLYFKDWFGSTTGPTYAGLVTSQHLYTNPGLTTPAIKIGSKYILTPGQTVYARVGVFNTGRGSWDEYGNLGTAAPRDRISPFATPSWPVPQRPAHVSNAPVTPSQTGIFTFSMQAPPQQGSYNESFTVVEDGKEWTNAITTFPIDVVSPLPSVTSNNFLASAGANTLMAGSTILSPDSYTALSLSIDGELTLRTNYETVWSVPEKAGPESRLVMQSDGNLVLYNKNMHPIWFSATGGRGASTLRVQEDSNLVVYSPSGASWFTATGLPTSHFNYTQYHMTTGSIMHAGQKMQTPDKKYTLSLQTDGNLVLYDGELRPIWWSGTNGQSATLLYMQADGNMVLYSPTLQPIWWTGTNGRGSSVMYTQQDGNLVIYNSSGPTWVSGTGR